MTIHEVVYEEEGSQSSEEDVEDPSPKYIVESSNQEFEEDLSKQIKDVREEFKIKPSREKEESDDDMEISTGPPTKGKDEGLNQEEEAPLEEEEGMKEAKAEYKPKEEAKMKKIPEQEHHVELK